MIEMTDKPSKPPDKPGKPRGKPGRSKADAKAQLSLAWTLRENVPASFYLDWHTTIAMGYEPELVIDDEGNYTVTFNPRGGIKPTLQQKTDSVKWLADRQWGQAPQMIHLEADIRQNLQVMGQVQLPAQLGPKDLAQLRQFLLTKIAGKPPSSGDSSEVIDAEFTEVAADEDPDLDPGQQNG